MTIIRIKKKNVSQRQNERKETSETAGVFPVNPPRKLSVRKAMVENRGTNYTYQ